MASLENTIFALLNSLTGTTRIDPDATTQQQAEFKRQRSLNENAARCLRDAI